MSPTLAEGVVRDELGADVDELFASWDPVPVAAASIGQVHRATLLDGTAVAVKVQYPGVDEAIGADLADARRLGALLSSVTLRSIDVDALAEELRDRMADELDYRIEAANQQHFADRYRGHPFIAVPDVVADRSSRRVLTSTWVGGHDLRRAGGVGRRRPPAIGPARRSSASPSPRSSASGASTAIRIPATTGSRPSGDVTALDFGLVKRLDDAEFDRSHAGARRGARARRAGAPPTRWCGPASWPPTTGWRPTACSPA